VTTHTQKNGDFMDNWYVISVWTGKENSLIDNIRVYNAERDIKDISPFVPTKEFFALVFRKE